jgi:hypothetical protein
VNGWASLRADPIRWLLDERQPHLLWRVLVELFDRPLDSVAVRRARGAASAAEPVATLLERLAPDGAWIGRVGWWSRYHGTGWRLVAAVAWGADPGDPRLQGGWERLLGEAPGEGGFSLRSGEPPSVPLTGRIVEGLARAGRLSHLRGQEALAWLEEEAELAPVSATATLVALVETPGAGRVRLAARCAEVILNALDGAGLRAPAARLGHPNLLRTDLLEMLAALAAAGVPFDPRMTFPLEVVQRQQDGQGRWPLGVAPPRSLPLGDERPQPGDPSPWLTLHAVRVLLRYSEEAALPRLFPHHPGE